MQRAIVLMMQQNFAQAEKELKRLLAESPSDPELHTHLALCLDQLDRPSEALDHAARAIETDPDDDFAHFVIAGIWMSKEEYTRARHAIDTAIQLNPFDAAYFARLSVLHAISREWEESLTAAAAGLAIDPEDTDCLNLQAQALRRLGRHAEAEDGLLAALYEDPDDHNTHTNLGYARLEEGKHREAMDHFHQALALYPNSDSAREGILTALKSRNPIYRLLLKYFVWINRFKQGNVVRIFGAIFVLHILFGHLVDSFPILAYIDTPFTYLYMTVALTTWLANPCFNLLLTFHPYGRLVLTNREKWESLFFGLAIAITACGWIGWWISRVSLTLTVGLVGLFLAVTCAGIQAIDEPEKRRAFITFGLTTFAASLLLIGLALAGSAWESALLGTLMILVTSYEIAIIVHQ